MRVLAVASEAFPLIKTGGLADVAGALPVALAAEGVHVTTLLPGYPTVLSRLQDGEEVHRWPDFFGGAARLLAGRAAALRLLVLDAPHLFARPGGPYQDPDGRDWSDNGIRFAALGAAAAGIAGGEVPGQGADLLHAHDWQAGLCGAYLRHRGHATPVVFTIHNLAYQGRFPASLMPRLGLPADAYSIDGIEYFGGLGYLKAGLWYADRITTVSPTYAAEIRTAEGGMGLDGLLRGRAGAVHGILNGIDTSVWDPEGDPLLPARFGAADPSPRAANKRALQARLGLEEDEGSLLLAMVGRIAWQKGFDLVLDAIPHLLAERAQLVLLGTGERELEARCVAAAAGHPGRVAAEIGFDEELAHLIYGGADAVLVPSRFEPCGLVQLCALRYGAVPVVARVGGLADTVIDANEAALAAGVATGVQFAPVSQEMLAAALQRTAALWRDRAAWRQVQANAMRSDVSWRRSAAHYAALFRSLIRPHG